MSEKKGGNVVYMYLMYDKGTDSYQNFKTFRNDNIATRYLDNMLNNPTEVQKEYQSYLIRYADTIQFLCIGEFDNDTGKVIGYDKHRLVAELSQFVNK